MSQHAFKCGCSQMHWKDLEQNMAIRSVLIYSGVFELLVRGQEHKDRGPKPLFSVYCFCQACYIPTFFYLS